jgi:hypothetical protein
MGCCESKQQDAPAVASAIMNNNDKNTNTTTSATDTEAGFQAIRSVKSNQKISRLHSNKDGGVEMVGTKRQTTNKNTNRNKPGNARNATGTDVGKNNEAVAVQGWLLKKGQGSGIMGRRNWKRRYFVLQGNRLKYYAKKKQDDTTTKNLGHDLKGGITITTTSILPIRKVDGAKYDAMFDIIQRKPVQRVLHLRAINETELNKWVKGVSNCPPS